MSQSTSKKCIHCFSIIPEKAKICFICTQHQSKTRIFVFYIGSILALVSALTTAIIHILAIFPDAKATLKPKAQARSHLKYSLLSN